MISRWKAPAGELGNAAGENVNGSLPVSRLPICDYCFDRAAYHGETREGRRANMCERHLRLKGGSRYMHLVVIDASTRGRTGAL